METNIYSALWFQLFIPLQTEELTEKDVDFLSRQLPFPRYTRVLDLCCGPGRHALRLARRGYQVVGLDRDETVVDEARRRAAEAGQKVTYTVGDMRQVSRITGTFDAVINMWQSFSYFDEETNKDVLRQIYSKLMPGGRFIIDMYNRDYFVHHQGSSRREISGIIVESHGYMQENRWHSVLTYSDEHGELGGDHMEWQMFSPEEFSAMAAQVGFGTELVCTWSDEHKMPAPDGARMQMVLEKR